MHGYLFLLRYFVLPWKMKTAYDVAYWDFNHSKNDSRIKDSQLDLNSLVNTTRPPPSRGTQAVKLASPTLFH